MEDLIYTIEIDTDPMQYLKNESPVEWTEDLSEAIDYGSADAAEEKLEELFPKKKGSQTSGDAPPDPSTGSHPHP